jgi:hypothetical protein
MCPLPIDGEPFVRASNATMRGRHVPAASWQAFEGERLVEQDAPTPAVEPLLDDGEVPTAKA